MNLTFDERKRLVPEHSHTDDYQKAMTKNAVRLGFWTVPWVVTMALATFGPSLLWDSNPVASWIAILGNLAIGVGMIIAHKRYIQGLDELQRKIMLEAMAVTLGVGAVAGLAYANMDIADLIAADAEIGVLIMLMGVVYVVTTVVGFKRYR